MKKFKKMLAILMSFALVVSFFPTNIFADNLNNNDGKYDNNFKLTMTGDNSWVYTHEENGESFKTVEEIHSDKEAHSLIYKKNSSGQYKLISEQITTIEDNKLIIEETINGNTTTTITEIINEIDPVLDPVLEEDSFLLEENDATLSNLTNWIHVNTSRGQYSVSGMTVSSIALVLGLFIPKKVAALVGLASLIYNLGAPMIYYTQYSYYKYLTGTTIPGAERHISYVYSDSNRTNLIESDDYIYYVD